MQTFGVELSKKASDMFNHHAVMPELVAKYFSRKAIRVVEQTEKPCDFTDQSVTQLQDQGTTIQRFGASVRKKTLSASMVSLSMC